MKKNKRGAVNTEALSTKDVIMTQSIEIINGIGMVDFRIDHLSEELVLSPGNITYHFSRKEELLNALWIEFYNKLETVDVLLTKIVDVKQFFLFFKSITNLIYKYRGVVMFRGGDVKFIEMDIVSGASFELLIDEKIALIAGRLATNGFVDKDHVNEDCAIIKSIASNVLINWINREILFNDKDSLADRINDNALLVLSSFSSMFTVKGKMQYEELKKMVSNNEIDF